MRLLIILLLLAPARDSLLLVSWNVENFLDYRCDSTGRYTRSRFYNKCNSLSKTLLLIAERSGRLPDAIALMEVGDRYVLKKLLDTTPLRKLDYGIVHYESPDRRGIDCALLYRRSRLKLLNSEAKHLYDSAVSPPALMHTRDILVAEFEGLDILVNHHPSKVGTDSERRRAIAMQRMWDVIDSLQAAGHRSIISVGDFNDNVWGQEATKGTIKYNGAWEKIDGYFARGLKVGERVFDDPLLSEADKSFGGTKPRRSFIGPRFNGGASDHYPVVLWISTQ
ncbi:MAG: hypothetical protein J6O51_05545 [Bacteroidales bacterium]|nr:hypothetical protein [Bacteroidales bacterium]